MKRLCLFIAMIFAILPPWNNAIAESQTSPDIAVTAIVSLDVKALNPVIIKQDPKPSFDDVIKNLKIEQAKEAADAQAKVDAEAAAEAARVQAEQQAQYEAEQAAINSRSSVYYSDTYDWGNCTYWVASQRGVPNDWGNARDWAWHGENSGWTVSSRPIVGAIAQTTAGYYGHVALVTGVGNGYITVSEMNVFGLGVVDTQTYPTANFTYIY